MPPCFGHLSGVLQAPELLRAQLRSSLGLTAAQLLLPPILFLFLPSSGLDTKSLPIQCPSQSPGAWPGVTLQGLLSLCSDSGSGVRWGPSGGAGGTTCFLL